MKFKYKNYSTICKRYNGGNDYAKDSKIKDIINGFSMGVEY